MPYKTREAKYYVRMFRDGTWYFLLRMVYNKKKQIMEPVWWPEHMQGESKPYLYKSLVNVRNMIDRLELPTASCVISTWENQNGQAQN